MTTKKQIKKFMVEKMRNENIFLNTVKNVESKIWQRFGDLCEDNLSINENWPDGSIDKSQKTGMITVQLSDLFEKQLVVCLNNELEQYGFVVERKADSKGDLTITHTETGFSFTWELKTTQGDHFQGATHSANKCNDYILLRFGVDSDKKLTMDDNTGFFTQYSAQVFLDMDNFWWFGKESKNNSRTTLKVPVSENTKWEESFVVGSAKPITRSNTKYCAGIMELLMSRRWLQ